MGAILFGIGYNQSISYKSISYICVEEKKMVLLTLNYVPGREIDALGMVKGNVVQSKNIGKDLLAGFKKLYGNAGRSSSHRHYANDQ